VELLVQKRLSKMTLSFDKNNPLFARANLTQDQLGGILCTLHQTRFSCELKIFPIFNQDRWSSG
jgi:hypothetical protein